MKAYLKTSAVGSPKFRTSLGSRVHFITKTSKLVVKNANRSRKKAARQESNRIVNLYKKNHG